MNKLIILLSFILVACNQVGVIEEVAHHDMFIKSERFKITFIKSENKQFVLTPISFNKRMELVPSEDDPKLLVGYTDEEKKNWSLEGLPPSLTVNSVSLLPYYSYPSYAFLSRFKESDKIYPDCPFTTKQLIIFSVGPQNYPIAGCIQ